MTKEGDFYILKVPEIWKDLYVILLKLMANFGIDIIKECNATCSNYGKQLIQCWITFNVACAAVETNNLKMAKILIIMLVDCLNNKYKMDLNYDDYTNFDYLDGEYQFDDNIFSVIDDGTEEKGYNFDLNIFDVEQSGSDDSLAFDETNFTVIQK